MSHWKFRGSDPHQPKPGTETRDSSLFHLQFNLARALAFHPDRVQLEIEYMLLRKRTRELEDWSTS